MSTSGGGDRYGGGGRRGSSGHPRDSYGGGGRRGSGYPQERYGERGGGGGGSSHGRERYSGGGWYDGDRGLPRDHYYYGGGGEDGGGGRGHARKNYGGGEGGYASDRGSVRRRDGETCGGKRRGGGYSGASGAASLNTGHRGGEPGAVRSLCGMRLILAGFSSPLRIEYTTWISEMGGQVLQSLDYELATHIVPLEGSEGCAMLWELEGKKVYSKEWLDSLYLRGKSNGVSTGKRTRQSLPMRIGENRKAKRKLDFFASEIPINPPQEEWAGDNFFSKYHHLLHCSLDGSTTNTLDQYAKDNKDSLISLIPTPGCESILSTVAESKLKTLLRRSFRLLTNLHKSNLSLCGKFSVKNFIFDEDYIVRFGNLQKELFKSSIDFDDRDLDYKSFVAMVKYDVFNAKARPNDIDEWLIEMSNGVGKEDLLCYHSGVLESHHNCSVFMSLYDKFLEMEKNDPVSYNSVLSDLKEFSVWTPKITENDYLNATYKRPGSKYNNGVRDLLRLLRNSRRHNAKFMESQFPLIVDQVYERLIPKFQKAMFKVKRLQELKLAEVM